MGKVAPKSAVTRPSPTGIRPWDLVGRENLVKKVVLSILALVLIAPLAGCQGVPSVAAGALFADVHNPGDAEGAVGGKKGEACATSYLMLVGVGDASIATAAANGGIKTVTNVDSHTTNLLGIIGKFCTIAYGN